MLINCDLLVRWGIVVESKHSHGAFAYTARSAIAVGLTLKDDIKSKRSKKELLSLGGSICRKTEESQNRPPTMAADFYPQQGSDVSKGDATSRDIPRCLRAWCRSRC